MSNVQLTPEIHSVFNEFDRHGLLLALPRIKGEKNAVYKQRLMDVFVNRANSTYRGLINGVTRELGLSITGVMQIIPVTDANDTPLATNPAVRFLNNNCILYEDFSEGTILETIDRFEPNGGAYSYEELKHRINATLKYEATILTPALPETRSMTIFNQSSTVLVAEEEISGAGSRINLANRNLIPNTVSVVAANFNRRVSSEGAISRAGDYYVDMESGNIISNTNPGAGSFVRYKYRDDLFIAQASPVILHNLQSDDFRSKMFQQVCDDLGVECNGLPTALGADIINELLSVAPTNWGI